MKQLKKWGRRTSAFVLTAAVLLSCTGRKRVGKDGEAEAGDGYVGIIDLSRGVPESTVGHGFFPLPAKQTMVGLLRTLDRLEDDEDVRGLFVRLRSSKVTLSQAAEVGDALSAVKESLPVVCHAHEADNANFWLLSRGCSEIWVSAAGDVPTVGIGAELSYVKGVFDKVGVRADMLAMGRYKSGGESLTRTGPSEDSLRNLKETLSGLREQWLAGVSEGVADPQARRQQVEDGPWTPQKAQSLGLIHAVGFEDEALDALKKTAKTKSKEHVFGPGAQSREGAGLGELVKLLAGAEGRGKADQRIAVVPALGSITMKAGGPFGGESGITAASMTRTLRRLRKDESVKAVVMRMNSPGGSPLASDLIWREMMLMRDKKPVIVSITGMSASGGYYIASGATKIVSTPTAIVGSIGVFGGKIVVGGALEKIGVTSYPVAASPEEGAAARALHLSPMTPWDEPTRERVRQSMQRIYDLFVERVAEGRKMEAQDVYATAEGEIYLATTGKERGLIDELGGIQKALQIARQEAGLDDDVPVVLEGASESVLEALLLGPDSGTAEVEAALNRFTARQRQAQLQFFPAGVSERLQPFAAVVAPLLAGESVVAALPFVLTIH